MITLNKIMALEQYRPEIHIDMFGKTVLSLHNPEYISIDLELVTKIRETKTTITVIADINGILVTISLWKNSTLTHTAISSMEQ